MGLAVGIDLGTTNSVVSVVDKHGKPVVIPNSENAHITPSVICFRDGEILIGDIAKEMQAVGAWPVAAFFKRQMGDPLFIFHVDGTDYTATELSSLLLQKLKADAAAQLGDEITHAVITVPAYFRNIERKATIEAGIAAGLEVLQVINEPTSAAIAFGLQTSRHGQRLLVYDLGGGTFDVTLLKVNSDGIQVLTSDGNHRLGGKDWDDRIIEYLARCFQDEFGANPLEDSESVVDLLIHAEDAKKKLTSVETASILLAHDGNGGRYELDRAKLEELTADLMEQTVVLTRRVLEDMRMSPSDIDGVVLVGGSTRMLMVQRFIQREFGRSPLVGTNVDEAVALGAAIVAAQQTAKMVATEQQVVGLGGLAQIIDVTNHSLGMIAVNADGSAFVNSIILPKNAEIPCNQTRPYQHWARGTSDNEIEVYMTQGETDAPCEAVYLGRYVIQDIPHDKSGPTVVEISYNYDHSGTVDVSARTKNGHVDLPVIIKDLESDVPARFLLPPEPLVSEHVTVYLSFDLSGSMSGRPIKEAKKAALGFLNNCDLSNCSIGVIAFSDRVETKLKGSQNARAIKHAINDLTVGETGFSNSAHPFSEIHGLLAGTKGRHFAITLADGVWSEQDRAVKMARACHDAEIDIIAIGFGDADQEFLDAIASSDENSFFTTMGGLAETFSTIAQVITESGGIVQST